MERDDRRHATGKSLNASTRNSPRCFGEGGERLRLPNKRGCLSGTHFRDRGSAIDSFIGIAATRSERGAESVGEKKSMQLLSSFMGRHTKRGASLKKGTSASRMSAPAPACHVTLISFNQPREENTW